MHSCQGRDHPSSARIALLRALPECCGLQIVGHFGLANQHTCSLNSGLLRRSDDRAHCRGRRISASKQPAPTYSITSCASTSCSTTQFGGTQLWLSEPCGLSAASPCSLAVCPLNWQQPSRGNSTSRDTAIDLSTVTNATVSGRGTARPCARGNLMPRV